MAVSFGEQVEELADVEPGDEPLVKLSSLNRYEKRYESIDSPLCRKFLRTICEDVGASPLYDTIYRGTSEWTHWTPRALGRAIRRASGKVRYSGEAKTQEQRL